MAFDLARHLLQHVDLGDFGAAFDHAQHHPVHPAHALAAGGALAAAFMLVEGAEALDGADQVGGFVHHDHARRAQAGFVFAQGVEIHQHIVAYAFGDHRRGGTAGDDGQQIVPAAAHAAGMAVDEFAQRHAHFFFDVAGLVHMALQAEDFGARILGAAEAGEPGGTAAQNGGRDGDGFDVIDRGGAAIEADGGGEWRFHPRHALLAFQALDQRGFLAADIGAGAAMQIELVIIARAGGVFAEQAGIIGLVDRGLEDFGFVGVFAADVDVAGRGAHGGAGDQAALDQLMRIVADDVAVLAGAGLALIGIDHEVAGAAIGGFGHEGPLHAGWEAGAAAAA